MTDRKRAKKALPDKYKKVDTTINGDAMQLAEKHRKIEQKLFPLRIDNRTVIYVPKHKQTVEYAEVYRKRMGMQEESKLHINHTSLTKDRLRELYIKQGMTAKEIGEKFGVSRTTVSNYIRRYNLYRNGENALNTNLTG